MLKIKILYWFFLQIVICAALGFDTFLVMRHGFHTGVDNPEKIAFSSTMSIPGDQLGCYFCNDVVAPGNVGVFECKVIISKSLKLNFSWSFQVEKKIKD